MAAFDDLAAGDPELRLVIAGPDGWGAAALDAALDAAHHRDRIVRLGWVDDDQRQALMRGAAVYAFYGYRHAKLGRGEVVQTDDA